MLFNQSLTGTTAHRRGIARILSKNLLKHSSEISITSLKLLMNDDDKDVQSQVAVFLYELRKNSQKLSDEVLDYVLALSKSKSVVQYGYILSTILWERGTNDPKWAISVIRNLLKNDYIHKSTVGNVLIQKT